MKALAYCTCVTIVVFFKPLHVESIASPCVLLPLPGSSDEWSYNQVHSGIVTLNSGNSSVVLIPIESKALYSTVVRFISRSVLTFIHFSNENVPEDRCEIAGVVGDVDAKTASILHTLASRSNLTFTIVAAVAPTTFLPVTNLALPNVLDMNPLAHYIEAIVSFIDHWNWTRIRRTNQ